MTPSRSIRTLCRWPALAAALLALCLALPQPLLAQQAASEYAVKATLLYKLSGFVYFPAPPAPLTVCIIGSNPFGTTLHKLAARSPDEPEKPPLSVRQLAGIEEATGCSFLFIAQSDSAKITGYLERLAGKAVLTVSDVAGFAAQGGHVELAMPPAGGSSLSIIINRREANAVGIRFSAQLLRLARIVE